MSGVVRNYFENSYKEMVSLQKIKRYLLMTLKTLSN